MTTRELFQSSDNKDLRSWWAQIVTDARFAQVLLYVRSAFLEVSPGSEHLDGARMYESILKGINEASDPGSDMLSKVSEVARLQSVDHLLTRKTNQQEKK